MAALEKEERDNYFSITLLLFRPGNKRLREYFKSRWQTIKHTSWIDGSLCGRQLIKVGGLGRLDPHEIPKVLAGDTESWDLSLLIKILKFSSVGFTVAGTPERRALDTLRRIRNKLICHASDARITNTDYQVLWNDACTALTNHFSMTAEDIDNVEKDIRKPWAELLAIMQQCLTNELVISIAVSNLHGRMAILEQGQQDIIASQENLQQGQQTILSGLETIDQGQQIIRVGQENIHQGVQSILSSHETMQENVQKMGMLLEKLADSTPQTQASKQSDREGQGTLAKIWKPAALQDKDDVKRKQQIIAQKLHTIRKDNIADCAHNTETPSVSLNKKEVEKALLSDLTAHEFFTSQLKTLYGTLCQGIAENIKDKEAIYQCFKDNESGEESPVRRVLIEGAPSSGKTTLCSNLARDWINSAIPINVDVVFYLQARKISGNILETIEEQLIPEHLRDDARKVEWFGDIGCNSKNILVIIDGLEEASQCREMLEELLRGDILPGCYVVATRRGSQEEEGKLARTCFDRVLQTSFSSDVFAFVHDYFDADVLTAANLASIIEMYPSLKKAMTSNLQIRRLICEVYKTFSETQAGVGDQPTLFHLYRKMVELHLTRRCSEVRMSTEDVVNIFYTLLNKFAFLAFVNNQWYFDQAQLLEDDRMFLSSLCFLNMVNHKYGKKFCFTDRSVAKYFAVEYFISCIESRNFREITSMNNGSIIYRAVRQFGAITEASLSTPTIKAFLVALLESSSPKADGTFAFELIGNIQSDDEILEVVNEVVASFPETIDIDCSIYLALRGFLKFFLRPAPLTEDRRTTRIKEILFHGLPKTQMTQMFDAFYQLKCLKCLRFGDKCDISVVGSYLEAFQSSIPASPSLCELDISRKTVTEVRDLQYFLTTLSELKALTSLTLKNLRLGTAGSKVISSMLIDDDDEEGLTIERNRLCTLKVPGCELGLIGFALFARVLRSNCTLEHFDVSENRIGPECASHLAKLLMENSTLKVLALSNNAFSAVVCTRISSGIKANKSLRELDLSYNALGDQGAIELMKNGIQDNTSLQTLRLNSCGITNDGMRVIVDVVKARRTVLRDLCVVGNAFGSSLAIELIRSNALTKFCFTMQECSDLAQIQTACEEKGYSSSTKRSEVCIFFNNT